MSKKHLVADGRQAARRSQGSERLSKKSAVGAVSVTQVGSQQALLINAGALQGAIFNSARISIIATDEKGVIQIFNAGAELMFGYAAAEVLNKVMPADLYDLEDVNARGKALSAEFGKPIASGFEALAYRAARGIEDTYELKKVRKDGSRFPGAVTVTTLRDTADHVIGYLLIGTDNTERKQVEEQLRLTEQSFRLMVESVADCAIVQLDPKGRVMSWNTGAERINGYSAEEIIGQNFSRFYSDADIEKNIPQRDLDTAASRGQFENESWQVRKDGSTYWANSIYTAGRDLTGNLRGFAKLTRDLTERQQVEKDLAHARDQALQASHAKSEFLANMSHEIRTPMNGVIGMTEVLRDTNLTPAQRDAVETIGFSSRLLLTIINDILDFSKVEAGMLRLDIIDFTMQHLVERVIGLFAELAADKGLKLNHFVDPRMPTVLRGDSGRLHQVLTNLVANALKFTEHGEIDVRVALEQESTGDALVRFTVRDTGPGVAKDVQQRLFQPFTQANTMTTRQHGGTGLGLAISKQLTELMGGEIGVESEPDKGATFWFTVRLEKSAALAESITMAQTDSTVVPRLVAETSRKRILRILVAEDNPVNQQVTQHQLSQLGLMADVVDNGRLAVDALQSKRHYDLVLMDCQMPELDGYSATAEIRRLEGTERHTWIVAMTAHAMGGDREKCLAAGMDDYLAKPVSKQALREALQRFDHHTAHAGADDSTPDVPTDKTSVNLQVFWDAADDDQEFAGKLAERYLAGTTEQLELLHTALGARDASKVESIAHRCKGGSMVCGASHMVELFRELEELGYEGQLDEANLLSVRIDDEFARVQTILHALPPRAEHRGTPT